MTKNEWADIILADVYHGKKTWVHQQPEYKNYILARNELLTKEIIATQYEIPNLFKLNKLGYEIIESGLRYQDWLENPQNKATYDIKITALERKFLKFLYDKETALTSEIDIQDFMVENFEKPNPKSKELSNKDDKGVVFLIGLKNKNLINYDSKALGHVNVWTTDTEGKIKRWFDTLHEPMYVWLSGQSFLFFDRLSRRNFVLHKINHLIKKTFAYCSKFAVSVWKFLVLIAATAIGGWLALDHNFMDVIHWIENLFKK